MVVELLLLLLMVVLVMLHVLQRMLLTPGLKVRLA